MKKIILSIFTLLLVCSSVFASPFNELLTEEDKEVLGTGDVLIKNIKYEENICLFKGFSPLGDALISEFEELNPKYLAEIIQYKPYEGNENLPEVLEELLYNVPEYAGIPYWSERHEKYFDLYSSAEIVKVEENEKGTTMYADLIMDPFGTVNEKIDLIKDGESILYHSVNINPLIWDDKIECVKENNMKLSILLFRDGDNWILYGIGGVNAPRFPFFTKRIEVAFMNRIKTFCNFIFEKF